MQEISESLGLEVPIQIVGQEYLDSCFAVSDIAASSIGAVGSALAGLVKEARLSDGDPFVQVNRRLASLWFASSIQPIDWEMPPVWDAIAGDYKTQDGWIKLHTNLPHHRAAALSVLEVEAVRKSVAKTVSNWLADDLESAIVSAGGVAAVMRSRQEWQAHPQGKALACEPLIIWGQPHQANISFTPTSRTLPLDGVKVLDLTRVLAGPVATRTLAGFGAQVLRIDPPGWEEAYVVPDITLGKRCARLELAQATDRDTFEALMADADVLVHGYRPGALHKLGYGKSERRMLAPNLIEVCLDAYGWSGPWAERRGCDSVVQMSCGIADAGMHWSAKDTPVPLPVQALDHATGYLMAAAVIQLLRKAVKGEGIGGARLSLARTAELLLAHPQDINTDFSATPELRDFSPVIERTPWGRARRLIPALEIQGSAMKWQTPANNLGTSPDFSQSVKKDDFFGPLFAACSFLYTLTAPIQSFIDKSSILMSGFVANLPDYDAPDRGNFQC